MPVTMSPMPRQESSQLCRRQSSGSRGSRSAKPRAEVRRARRGARSAIARQGCRSGGERQRAMRSPRRGSAPAVYSARNGGMSPRFSERLGLVSATIQTDGISEPLRNSLWNYVGIVITASGLGLMLGSQQVRHREVVQAIAAGALRVPIEHVPSASAREWLLDRYSKLSWHEALDMVEWVVKHVELFTSKRIATDQAMKTLN